MFCQQCGTNLGNDKKQFCPNCGSPVSEQPIPPSIFASSSKKRSFQARPVVIALCLLVVVAVPLLRNSFSNKQNTEHSSILQTDTAANPSNQIVAGTMWERLSEAEEAYKSGDMYTAERLYEALLTEMPDKDAIYISLAEMGISDGDYEAARGILEIGYAATGSDKIHEMLFELNVADDFGAENQEIITEGLEVIEQLAELTDNSDKLEVGKEIYDLLRKLK